MPNNLIKELNNTKFYPTIVSQKQPKTGKTSKGLTVKQASNIATGCPLLKGLTKIQVLIKTGQWVNTQKLINYFKSLDDDQVNVLVKKYNEAFPDGNANKKLKALIDKCWIPAREKAKNTPERLNTGTPTPTPTLEPIPTPEPTPTSETPTTATPPKLKASSLPKINSPELQMLNDEVSFQLSIVLTGSGLQIPNNQNIATAFDKLYKITPGWFIKCTDDQIKDVFSNLDNIKKGLAYLRYYNKNVPNKEYVKYADFCANVAKDGKNPMDVLAAFVDATPEAMEAIDKYRKSH